MSSTRLFAIGSQLSPEVGSSGIEMLETDVFKLHCFQTLTGLSNPSSPFATKTRCFKAADLNRICRCLSGIKFIVLADPRQAGIDALLRKIYEIYSDFALKNPFYSLEMPIRQVTRDTFASYSRISNIPVSRVIVDFAVKV